MIQKNDGSGRRILTFPAVHPSETIGLATLLTSSITLTHKISYYRSRSFSTNARNARETIRHVSSLLILFQEINAFGSGLPESATLGLSELHLTLQKVLYLLEDCTREGARLWMLMKSDRVASEFRVLVRAISTGLDVLPLGSMNLGSEVVELVRFVMSQTRKSRYEVDRDDARGVNEVMEILNQFENGVVPDWNCLKRVLDSIGVKKWSDCNKEVKFLDSEIESKYLSKDKKRREVEMLNSLIGFMCYSRCVVFDSIDAEIVVRQELDRNVVGFLNGDDDFRCPISLEIMKDPVAIETGHTYDRSSILKWFRSGNATCPKTGKKLASTEVVPNLVVKRLLQQYCANNGIPVMESNHKSRDITWSMEAGSLAADGVGRMVASFLSGKLEKGGCLERSKAAYEIRLLTKSSIFYRSCLVEAGVAPRLLKMLSCHEPLCQENAIAALLNLSKHSKSKAVIVENAGLESIVHVLMIGLTPEAKQHAAATLFYLASIEEYRMFIGECTEAIPALLEMIKNGNGRGKKNALVAIYGLLMHSCNHKKVLATGTVPSLLDLLQSSEREELVTDSLAVLATLAETPDGAKAITRAGTLPRIVEILEYSTSRATKEQCVSLLLALCVNSGATVVPLLVKNPTLMGSLYSLLNEGSSRARKKAATLINILHQYFERSSSGEKSPVVPREQFVHVW